MRKNKAPRRRPELSRIAGRIKHLGTHTVPPMSGEDQLRKRVEQHFARESRYGIDGSVLRAVYKIIETHVIEMRGEIARHFLADDVELRAIEAQLDRLAAEYGTEERHKSNAVDQLGYQARGALRVIEDRDTSMPAGRDGTEEAGYQHGNPGDVVPRSVRTQIVLYVVLLLAMIADLITFRQVVERVANDSAVLPLVLAITVTTTYVAHLAGEVFKSAKEARRRVRKAYAAWLLAGTWFAMGIGAFVFRLLAPAPAGNVLDIFENAGNTSAAADGSAVLNAVLLFLLYVVTGTIAVTAGYRRPRVEVHQFRWSDRKMRLAEPSLAQLRGDVAEVEALRRHLSELRTWREQLYADELGRCDAAADRLKAEADMMARHVGEPNWVQRLLGRRAPAVGSTPTAESTGQDAAAAPAPRRADGRHRAKANGHAAQDDGLDADVMERLAHTRSASGSYDARPARYAHGSDAAPADYRDPFDGRIADMLDAGPDPSDGDPGRRPE